MLDRMVMVGQLLVTDGRKFSREAPGYDLLSAVIKAGCRAAIKVSERF